MPLAASAKLVPGSAPVSILSPASPSRWIALGMAILCLGLQVLFRAEILMQVFSVTVLAGCGIVIGRPRAIVRLLERSGLWIERKMNRAGKGGKFRRMVVRPMYGLCHLVTMMTRRIVDPFVRNGLRLSSWIVTGAIGIFVVVAAAVAIAYVAIVIVVLLLVLWISLKMLEQSSGGSSGRYVSSGGTRQANDWLGNRKEEVYKGSKKVGEIRRSQDWLGRPKEDVYREGRKTGEIRPSQDWLGNPRKEIFEDGKKVGEIRPTTDLLGRPKEEVYRDGQKVGEQVPGEDWLGQPKKDLYGSGHPGTKDEPEKGE